MSAAIFPAPTVEPWYSERVPIALHGVSGSHAAVLLRRDGDTWIVGWSTSAPGWGTRCSQLPISQGFANRWCATNAGLLAIRNYWRSRDVPALVAALDHALDQWG